MTLFIGPISMQGLRGGAAAEALAAKSGTAPGEHWRGYCSPLLISYLFLLQSLEQDFCKPHFFCGLLGRLHL
jgi:hypothetical protein